MKKKFLILIPLLVCFALPVMADGQHVIIRHYVEIHFDVVSSESVKLYSVTNRGKDDVKVKLDGNENSKPLKPGQTREYKGVECRLIQAVIAYGSCTVLNDRILGEYMETLNSAVSGTDAADKSGDTAGGGTGKSDAQQVTEPEVQGGKKSEAQAEEKPAVNPVKTAGPEKKSESGKQTKTETGQEAEPVKTVPEKKSEPEKQMKTETKQVVIPVKTEPEKKSESKERTKVEIEKELKPVETGQKKESESGKQTETEIRQEVKSVQPLVQEPDIRQDVGMSTPSRNKKDVSSRRQTKHDAEKEKRSGRKNTGDIVPENEENSTEDGMDDPDDSLPEDDGTTGDDVPEPKHFSILIYSLAILAVASIIVLISRRNRGRSGDSAVAGRKSDAEDEGEQVVVVQKSHDIRLKRQSLDDVRNSDSYYLLDSRDFCHGSAVRRIYLKNSCIKEIYNMYADDLRNPDKPDEDGCMVLGRWVTNPDGATYDISMEYVVRPGDDAVFQEYELNFGGKIKMKMSERLRKLRRDTDLQYDLTCWVHSHPGLGVFFSNYDSSVQMQLKHPVHPYFLTAMVVDILTPSQEFGVFSFRQDESITSRNDLTRLYSLEELYKWAVDSERKGISTDDYYNILEGASVHTSEYAGIELANNSIIDICRLAAEHTAPSLYGIYGYFSSVGGKDELIVQRVSSGEIYDGNELIGCLCTGTHCSIPTIRKTLSENIGKYKFVIFYSSVDEELTVIPITGGSLVTDERYYTQNKLETLKLWTRRRR